MAKEVLKPLKSKVAVTKLKKQSSDDQNKMFKSHFEDEQSYGVVRYIGPRVRKVGPGDVVMFGDEFKRRRFGGEEVLMMDEDNVFATKEEIEEEEE